MNIKNIENGLDFEEEVLNSKTPVMVDFWATWCGPCKSMLPILEELSVEKENIKIVKVDVDQNPEIAQKYGVRGVPTLMIINNGEPEATKVGALTKSALVSFIDMNV